MTRSAVVIGGGLGGHTQEVAGSKPAAPVVAAARYCGLMSEENLKSVARIFSDGIPGVYGVISGTTEDFIWDMTKFDGFPEPREFVGIVGFVEFLQAWVKPYEEWRVEVDEMFEAGGDRVVVLLRQLGRIQSGESRVEMRYGIVYSLRNEKISRATPYATPEQALEAAGLSE